MRATFRLLVIFCYAGISAFAIMPPSLFTPCRRHHHTPLRRRLSRPMMPSAAVTRRFASPPRRLLFYAMPTEYRRALRFSRYHFPSSRRHDISHLSYYLWLLLIRHTLLEPPPLSLRVIVGVTPPRRLRSLRHALLLLPVDAPYSPLFVDRALRHASSAAR